MKYACSFLRFFIFFCLAIGNQSALAQPIPEYEMKAAYLYNFALFTEWPDSALETAPTNAIRLCIFGNDNFGTALAGLTRARNNGIRIQLSYLYDIKSVNSCQILFIDGSELKNASRIIEQVANTPILTISDNEALFRSGLMVGLFLENKRLTFDVNYTKINNAKITISSKLLRMARQVTK